jgi:hypothetical protein
VAFFRRHKSLKRIVLCLEGLWNNKKDDDGQEEDEERGEEGDKEGDEEGDEQLIKEIQAIL